MKPAPRLLAICNYPSETRPAHQVFVRALLLEMRSLGADITVIAPESRWNQAKARTGFRLPSLLDERDGLPVHRPRYMTYSNIRLPWGGTTSRWGVDAYARAVLNRARKLPGKFDFCMGHFLYPQGFAAARVGAELGIPTVVSLGESSFDRYESTYQAAEITRLFGQFSGVISNSRLLRDRSVELYGLAPENVRVLPNGVDEELFYPRGRASARRELGLPPDRPIVIFTGQFIQRKGPMRVLQAIQPRPEIGAVFLGYGPQAPQGPQVLHQGEVPHEDVPLWLSAADLFVLPTLNEGCSNSILEALFCGLPVVSSDLPFNQDILNEQVSIMVDPRDVNALGQAIFALVDSPERREAMGKAALLRSNSFRLADRARHVLQFLEGLC
ncbi:MAG: glycosyltransferase [Bacteroidota bacterium]